MIGALGVDCSSPSPCTWWDYVYARDACISYSQACDPTSIFASPVISQGLIQGGAEVIGTSTGTAVGTGANSFIQSMASTIDPTTGLSTVNWSGVLVLIGGSLLALMLLRKALR